MQNESDKVLTDRIQAGDAAAFEAMVIQYRPKLIASLVKYTKSVELSEDIAQQTFIKVCQKIDTFSGDSALFTWIYRIAINTAKNSLSSKARSSEIYDDDLMDLKLSESAITVDNPENILEADQLRTLMMDAIQNLPDDIRTTLSLREFDGLSYEEIADVQNCPIGTVRSRIHKGREILDKTFSKYNLSNLETNLL